MYQSPPVVVEGAETQFSGRVLCKILVLISTTIEEGVYRTVVIISSNKDNSKRIDFSGISFHIKKIKQKPVYLLKTLTSITSQDNF